MSFQSLKRFTGTQTARLIVASLLLVTAACSPRDQNSPGTIMPGEAAGIFGGKEAKGDEDFANNVVAVKNLKRKALCSGVLISPSLVLTAAHCTMDATHNELSVIFARDLSSPDKVVRIVDDFEVAPAWKGNIEVPYEQNDIAMLRISGGLPPGYQALPVLATMKVRVGWPVTIAGFGMSDPQANTGSGILRYGVTNILDDKFGTNPESSEFVVVNVYGVGTCGGDSGGPVSTKINGQRWLLGVLSRGDSKTFAVYTSVRSFANWMDEASARLTK